MDVGKEYDPYTPRKYRKGNLKIKGGKKEKKKGKRKKEKGKKRKKKKGKLGKKEILWTMRARRKNRCGDAGWVRCNDCLTTTCVISQYRDRRFFMIALSNSTLYSICRISSHSGGGVALCKILVMGRLFQLRDGQHGQVRQGCGTRMLQRLMTSQ